MPIGFKCKPNSATLTLSGDLTQNVALEMREHLRAAREYYHYAHVEIEINSPGGEALAMRSLAAEMQWLRSQGCTVATTALMDAGSASAVTLSLGNVGHRSVQPYTQLLFHHARVMRQGEYALTAIDANATAIKLQSFDKNVVGMIIKHLVHSHGNLISMASSGLDRCEKLYRNASKVAMELGSDSAIDSNFDRPIKKGRKNVSWLGKTQIAYERIAKSNNAEAFNELLTSIFALDQRMPMEMAWVLHLIDKVEGSTVLAPEPSNLKSCPDILPARSLLRLAA